MNTATSSRYLSSFLLLSCVAVVGCGGSSKHRSGGSTAALASGTAAEAASESVERAPLYHRAASLPGAARGAAVAPAGGEAIVVGGASPGRGATDRVADLVLASGQTRARPTGLVVARVDHGLVPTSTGWLAFGGRDAAGAPLDSFERYEFATGRWELESQTLGIEGQIAATLLRGLLVVTARGADRIEIWDTESLELLGWIDMPVSVGEDPHFVTALADGVVFLYASQGSTWFDIRTTVAFHYTDLSMLPQRARAVGVEGYGVVFFGGYDSAGVPLERAHFVDPFDYRSRPFGPILPPVERPAAALLADGSFLVAGGTWGGFPLDRVLRLDGSVVELTPLSEPRSEISVVNQLEGFRVAFVGGEGSAGPSTVVDLYGFTEFQESLAFLEASARRAAREAEEAELASLRDETRSVKAEIEVLRQTLATRKGELSAAREARAKLESELATARRALADAEAALAALEARFAQANAHIARLGAEDQANRLRLVQLRQEAVDLRRQGGDASSARDREQARLDRLQGELQTTNAQIASTTGQVATLQGQVKRAKSRAAFTVSLSNQFGSVAVNSKGKVSAQVGSPTPQPAAAPAPAAPSNAPAFQIGAVTDGSLQPGGTPPSQVSNIGGAYTLASVRKRLAGGR